VTVPYAWIKLGTMSIGKLDYYYNANLAQDFQAADRYLLSETIILKGDTVWTPNKLNN
jgi:hypothetical protein